jgi:hypothetical protein
MSSNKNKPQHTSYRTGTRRRKHLALLSAKRSLRDIRRRFRLRGSSLPAFLSSEPVPEVSPLRRPSRHKFRAVSEAEVYEATKALLVEGSPPDRFNFKSFEGVRDYLAREAPSQPLTVSKELLAKTLNMKKSEVDKAFRRLNQEGWVSNRPIRPRSSAHRGDGWDWRANSYEVRVSNIVEKGLLRQLDV